MYTLEEIYQQAMEDQGAYHPKHSGKQGILKIGILLNKYSDRIEILNTTRGGDYFMELTPKEYSFFYENGWKKGVILTSMHNYERKLKMIEGRIQNELNTRKNDKHIQSLKASREKILRKYAERKKLLSQLN